MKKKLLAVLLSATLTSGFLMGCGGSQNQTNETEAVTETEEKGQKEAEDAETETAAETTDTTDTAEAADPFGYQFVEQDVEADLTVYRYYADADKTDLDFAMNKMQEKYPNLSFTIEHRTDSAGEALRTWAAVGELPDIFEINSAEVYDMLKEEGTLYIVDDEVEKTGFYELFSNGAAAKEARTADDGHQYGFGCEVGHLGALWYNKDTFQELGIEEPTNYEEFKETLQVLKDAGKVPIALFAAEKWPATTLFSMAAIAEGQPEGLDAVNNGTASITEDVYKKAAEKYIEISNLGAFGKGALSTNYQQAYEMMYSGEAGYFLSGAWFFLTLESDGMGDKIDYCNYNVFADDAVKEEVRWNAIGGYQTESKFSVNAAPPCGLEPSTVAYLGLEMEYWVRVAAGISGNMTTVIGDFNFKGGAGYQDYYENYGNYKTFTNFTGDLSNGEFVTAADNACEMVISGNYKTADELINDIASSGF